jgi:hypothetical protein
MDTTYPLWADFRHMKGEKKRKEKKKKKKKKKAAACPVVHSTWNW